MKFCWKCNDWKDTQDDFCADCGEKLHNLDNLDIKAFKFKGKIYDLEKIADILKHGKWEIANKTLRKQTGFTESEARSICRFLKKYNELPRLEEERKQKKLEQMDAESRKTFMRKNIASKVESVAAEGGESLYEYKVINLIDKATGACDVDELEMLLNEYAARGWRVKSVISNELGKNALAVMGIGVNGVVDQVIVILERDIRLSVL